MAYKWDYERPDCLWERWPWWMRWPIAAAIVIYFVGGALAFIVGMSRVSQ